MPRPISSVSVTAEYTVSCRTKAITKAAVTARWTTNTTSQLSCCDREPVQHAEQRDHREHDREERGREQRSSRPNRDECRLGHIAPSPRPVVANRTVARGCGWSSGAGGADADGSGCCRGGWGIRTPEGFHPTRFPSVRHRPLGESSWTPRRWPPQGSYRRDARGHARTKGGPADNRHGSPRGAIQANSPRAETQQG